MKQLPPWVLTNPLPSVHDLDSRTSIELTARVYGAMQSLIDEVNGHIANVNKIVGENDAELTTALQNFEQRFTCISNDLVKMVREYEQRMDTKIADAVADAVTDGKLVEDYDPTTEALTLKWEVKQNE